MKFIAHRGNDNHSYYENSKEALLWCLDQDYIDGVELDIRLTKDKKFLIHHNNSFLELGNKIHFVQDETLEELQKINLGTKKNPHHLDSLEDFLSRVKSSKMILLDVKKEIGDFTPLIRPLQKILKKYDDLNLYLCSFQYSIIKLSTKMCKVKIGLLVSDFINKNKNYDAFDFLSVSKGAYPDISSSKKKMVWTIQKKSELKRFSKDIYVITDCAYHLGK